MTTINLDDGEEVFITSLLDHMKSGSRVTAIMRPDGCALPLYHMDTIKKITFDGSNYYELSYDQHAATFIYQKVSTVFTGDVVITIAPCDNNGYYIDRRGEMFAFCIPHRSHSNRSLIEIAVKDYFEHYEGTNIASLSFECGGSQTVIQSSAMLIESITLKPHCDLVISAHAVIVVN